MSSWEMFTAQNSQFFKSQIYTAQNSASVYVHQHFLSAHKYLQPNIDFGYLDPIFQNTQTIKVLKTVFIDASHDCETGGFTKHLLLTQS